MIGAAAGVMRLSPVAEVVTGDPTGMDAPLTGAGQETGPWHGVVQAGIGAGTGPRSGGASGIAPPEIGTETDVLGLIKAGTAIEIVVWQGVPPGGIVAGSGCHPAEIAAGIGGRPAGIVVGSEG